MSPTWFSTLSLTDCDHPHSDTWVCPVCSVLVEHTGRPGRRRVYCTNACRQRAYRRRRREQVITTHTNARPAERAVGRTGVLHALRTERDASSRPSYGLWREELSVCGVLARPGRTYKQPGHYRFVTGSWSCATCESLTFAEPTPPFVWPLPPRVWRPPLRYAAVDGSDVGCTVRR
jgi:hypothetical protein